MMIHWGGSVSFFLRLIFCTLLLLDVFKPPTALSGRQEQQLSFSRFTRAGSPSGPLQIFVTLRVAGKGMAEPHFSSTSRYQRATKNDIFAARSPYRSLLLPDNNGESGRRDIDTFLGNFGKKGRAREKYSKMFCNSLARSVH